MNSGLCLRLFGPLEAQVDDASLPGLKLREGERLLALLTLLHGQDVSYRALAQRFWPSEARINEGMTGDFVNTRQAIRALRQALGTEAERLVSRGKGIVSLDLTGAEVDLLAFDARTAQDNIMAWREALDWYRAPLLADWSDPWVLEARARRKRSFDRIVKQVTGHFLEQGDPQTAEPYLRKAVSFSPGEERYVRDLMCVLAAQARYPEMEEIFETLRFHVEREKRSLEPETLETLAVLRPRAGTIPLPSMLSPPVPPSTPTTIAPQTASGITPSSPGSERAPTGGAVTLDSPDYIVRPADHDFQAALERPDSIVLIKGARQIGKTSLLARGLHQARRRGVRIVFTDLQTLNTTQLDSADTLFQALAAAIALQLDLDMGIKRSWDPDLGANMNLEMFVRRQVLSAFPEPFVWGIDEADRLFGRAYTDDVFGLFRSWHNRRSLDPTGPWSRLTLAIAYATEAHLFITDINQSPFNVGTRIALTDFTLAEVAELNTRYGSPLSTPDDVERFYSLFNGQPYLVRCGLDTLLRNGIDLAALERQADDDDGPFGDHLRRLRISLIQDPELAEAMQTVMASGDCPTPELFYRLRSAGLLSGEWGRVVRVRCRLYTSYLARYLR